MNVSSAAFAAVGVFRLAGYNCQLLSFTAKRGGRSNYHCTQKAESRHRFVLNGLVDSLATNRRQDNDMMTREQIVERHIQLCWSFARTALVKIVMHEVLPQTRIDFWRIIQGGTLDLAVIEWCKLFGNRGEDTHWTQLIPETDHNKFRTDLRAATEMNETEWDKYWHSMMVYRNEVAAHHDLDLSTAHYPSFDAALKAVYHYHNIYLFPEWMRIMPQTTYPPDMREYAKEYQEELRTVAAAATEATKSLEPGRAG